MGERSKIEWTDHTFNPWVGCTKVSPGCDHCYAESWAKRTGNAALWNGARRRTTSANWRQPIAWNREAHVRGVRYRVFCASLADVFDNAVPMVWREDLFALIDSTPHLDWLLLTKRVGNVLPMLDAMKRMRLPPHVWLGSTVVTQEELERDVPKLARIPATVHFLSCEPLLESIDLGYAPAVEWVIVGGESGPRARPLVESWCIDIARQCARAGSAFFMKQGSAANWPHWKEFDRWHDELRVRQFPRPSE